MGVVMSLATGVVRPFEAAIYGRLSDLFIAYTPLFDVRRMNGTNITMFNVSNERSLTVDEFIGVTGECCVMFLILGTLLAVGSYVQV